MIKTYATNLLYVGMELPAEVISEWEEINNNVYNTRHCIYHWHRT